MKQTSQSRRDFLKKTLWATGAIIVAPNFISCSSDDDTSLGVNPGGFTNKHFNEGVASFDPTSSSVTIWTRYNRYGAEVIWEVSATENFSSILRTGTVATNPDRDYTIAIELTELEAAQTLYYRFICAKDESVSVTGETITLPADPSQVKLAVCSCSNYQAGYFNVYEAMANSDADIIVHLGDYLYEYGAGEYGATPETAQLNRAHKPANEMVSLDDYRTRYRQYRGDAQLKLAHQKKPFICVWDDHEIANDAYIEGAENHQEATEGSWSVRKQRALQAYSEFIPFSRVDENNNSLIYRTIKIGSLVNLIMLDTRVIARSKQLVITDYFGQSGFDAAAFTADLTNPARTLLGTTQLSWVVNEIATSNAQWQVLGQQVLMGKMMVPAELLLAFGQPGFTQILTELVTIKMRMLQGDPSLTPQEIARVETKLPYNLDAWDGYPVDRETLYAQLNGKKIVTLAGDTHNAWHNVLRAQDGTEVGVELATSSVSSPGFETYLGDVDAQTVAAFQQSMVLLVDGLEYFDAAQRGYIMATFTQAEVKSEWIFVNTILSKNFTATTGHTVVYS